MSDELLISALAKHLCLTDECSTAACPDHWSTADSALKFLVNAGAILPPGIRIGAVFEVFRDGDRDGYEFTDRREAEDHARFGGTDGRCGEVRTAWRIKADGVDTLTTWRPLDG